MSNLYRLYIDESGDHSYRGVDSEQTDRRYLCLLGCAFNVDEYSESFCPAMGKLKVKYFGQGPDDPVILHREEMVAKHGVFSVLIDAARNKEFCEDFISLIEDQHFRLFAVVVDKFGTQGKKYGPLPTHPYHIGVLAMMERYYGWLNFTKGHGDVLAESRGGREDSQLKSAYRTVYDSGTRFRGAEFFQSALTSKEIKLKKKEHNIVGLQLADLLAYPVRREMLHEVKRGNAPSGFTKAIADSLSRKGK